MQHYTLTKEQANAMVGREIKAYDDSGDLWWSGAVAAVVTGQDGVRLLSDRTDPDEIWIAYNFADSDGYSIEIIGETETLDAKIERLRAELAEAEAEKARDGAPEGWRWDAGKLKGPEGEFIRLSRCPGDIFIADSEGDVSRISFDAVAAFVDRVRRDRGEPLPVAAAPASGRPGASQVSIPEGWTVGRDAEGPWLVESPDEHGDYLRLELYTSGDIRIVGVDDGYHTSIGVPQAAMRAFLALCDK